MPLGNFSWRFVLVVSSSSLHPAPLFPHMCACCANTLFMYYFLGLYTYFAFLTWLCKARCAQRCPCLGHRAIEITAVSIVYPARCVKIVMDDALMRLCDLNNNNEYKHILSKFNAYNMNAHTDSHKHTLARARAHTHTHKTLVVLRRYLVLFFALW